MSSIAAFSNDRNTALRAAAKKEFVIESVMTDCIEQPRLNAYHDGELPTAERDVIAAHLASCPACTAELAAMARQSQLMQSMTLPRFSQMAAARLHASIDRSIAMANEQGMLRIARTLASLAACVLVAGSVWLSVGPDRSKPKTAPPWTGVALNTETEAVSQDITTPAAQWYLVDASKEETQNAGGER